MPPASRMSSMPAAMSHGARRELPERLEAPAGDVGEIERRGAGAADARGLAHDARQQSSKYSSTCSPSLNGKPVPISARAGSVIVRDGDRLAVEARAAAARRRE